MRYTTRNGHLHEDGVRIYEERVAAPDAGCRCRWKIRRTGKKGAPSLSRYCPEDVWCRSHSESLEVVFQKRAASVMATALDLVCGDPMAFARSAQALRYVDACRRLLARALPPSTANG